MVSRLEPIVKFDLEHLLHSSSSGPQVEIQLEKERQQPCLSSKAITTNGFRNKPFPRVGWVVRYKPLNACMVQMKFGHKPTNVTVRYKSAGNSKLSATWLEN